MMDFLGMTVRAAAVGALLLLASACGSDDTADDSASDSASVADDEAANNACPAEGCLIDFGGVAAADGEIEVTWEINFAPDLNNNHIHIYWDNFVAAQVSSDATERGVDQGDWVPTDVMPSYVTGGPVSTDPGVRGDSTVLCLVAADRDHNVIDESTEVCEDVSHLL